jgi:hypothetical protein
LILQQVCLSLPDMTVFVVERMDDLTTLVSWLQNEAMALVLWWLLRISEDRQTHCNYEQVKQVSQVFASFPCATHNIHIYVITASKYWYIYMLPTTSTLNQEIMIFLCKCEGNTICEKSVFRCSLCVFDKTMNILAGNSLRDFYLLRFFIGGTATFKSCM